MSLRDVVAAIRAGGEEVEARPLSGGMTNTVFAVTLPDGTPACCKLFRSDDRHADEREWNALCLLRDADAEFAPTRSLSSPGSSSPDSRTVAPDPSRTTSPAWSTFATPNASGVCSPIEARRRPVDAGRLSVETVEDLVEAAIETRLAGWPAAWIGRGPDEGLPGKVTDGVSL